MRRVKLITIHEREGPGISFVCRSDFPCMQVTPLSHGDTCSLSAAVVLSRPRLDFQSAWFRHWHFFAANYVTRCVDTITPMGIGVYLRGRASIGQYTYVQQYKHLTCRGHDLWHWCCGNTNLLSQQFSLNDANNNSHTISLPDYHDTVRKIVINKSKSSWRLK